MSYYEQVQIGKNKHEQKIINKDNRRNRGFRGIELEPCKQFCTYLHAKNDQRFM